MLGQRHDVELLLIDEDRTAEPQGLQDMGRDHVRGVRLHRALLQPGAQTLKASFLSTVDFELEAPLCMFPGRSNRWVLPHHLPTVQWRGSLSNDNVMAASTLAAVGAALRSLDSIDMDALRIAALGSSSCLSVRPTSSARTRPQSLSIWPRCTPRWASWRGRKIF